jgi:hypothetical protein
VPVVLKSGNLNLLEPAGPVQVCNGISLPSLFFKVVQQMLTSFSSSYLGMYLSFINVFLKAMPTQDATNADCPKEIRVTITNFSIEMET